MHEMGLAEGVLEAVLESAQGKRVRRVRVQIGGCLLVVPDSFLFSFELAAAGTDAEGAIVELHEIVPRIRCRRCQQENESRASPFLCQSCGSTDVQIVAGEDMRLEEMELADGTLLRDQRVSQADALAEHFREFGPHDH
jgi:hydrogenase nickel incorporation protein HypA/HybF